MLYMNKRPLNIKKVNGRQQLVNSEQIVKKWL